MRRIPASACPLCDYDSILRRRRLHIVEGDSTLSEPLTVTTQNFRSHLGRHLEQLALFVLPKKEVIEQSDWSASSHGAQESVGAVSELDANSGKGEVFSKEKNFVSVEPQSDQGAAVQNISKQSEGTSHIYDDPRTTSAMIDDYDTVLDETQGDEGPTPDLAMGWQPPMDFQPPAEDFEEADIDWLPRREDSMFGGDLFTPGWIRGYGPDKEGFCGRCDPGVWQSISDLSYHFHITYKHGISSSGIPLPRPSSMRRRTSRPGEWEGYCDACQQWQLLKKIWMGWNWFTHFVNVSSCAVNTVARAKT